MSAEIVNEQISMMELSVLRTLLSNIKMVQPSWFLIIADKSSREQLNLSLRWVNEVKAKLASFAFQTLLQIQSLRY